MRICEDFKENRALSFLSRESISPLWLCRCGDMDTSWIQPCTDQESLAAILSIPMYQWVNKVSQFQSSDISIYKYWFLRRSSISTLVTDLQCDRIQPNYKAINLYSLPIIVVSELTLPMLRLLSSKAQGRKSLKTIWTLSSWYSLETSHRVLSDEYPFARVSVIF